MSKEMIAITHHALLRRIYVAASDVCYNATDESRTDGMILVEPDDWQALNDALDALEEAEFEQEQRAPPFWLVLQESGRVPEQKGPWSKARLNTILREFMEARPTAYIHVLTVSEDGVPFVEHGPEVLQMDGRSISTGRKHNGRVRVAHEDQPSRSTIIPANRELDHE